MEPCGTLQPQPARTQLFDSSSRSVVGARRTLPATLSKPWQDRVCMMSARTHMRAHKCMQRTRGACFRHMPHPQTGCPLRSRLRPSRVTVCLPLPCPLSDSILLVGTEDRFRFRFCDRVFFFESCGGQSKGQNFAKVAVETSTATPPAPLSVDSPSSRLSGVRAGRGYNILIPLWRVRISGRRRSSVQVGCVCLKKFLLFVVGSSHADTHGAVGNTRCDAASRARVQCSSRHRSLACGRAPPE